MIRYACPVCDRVMKRKHYCSFCRQFVRTPYVSKFQYYLNEKHPANESDCEYHNSKKYEAQTELIKKITAEVFNGVRLTGLAGRPSSQKSSPPKRFPVSTRPSGPRYMLPKKEEEKMEAVKSPFVTIGAILGMIFPLIFISGLISCLL